MGTILTHLLETIISMGYFGVVLALMIEVIPSELVLAYGGFMIGSGHLSFIGVVIAGTVGATIAQIILYWIGSYGGRPFLNKYGKYLLIHKNHLDTSERWFQKYGASVVFFARFIPLIRQVISLPAGITKMRLGKFIFYTVLATIPWCIVFIYLGEKLGQNWHNIKTLTGPYLDIIAVVIIAIAILILIIKMVSSRRKFKS